jgi:hypothetical protein
MRISRIIRPLQGSHPESDGVAKEGGRDMRVDLRGAWHAPQGCGEMRRGESYLIT